MEDGTFETQSRLTFIGTRYENEVQFVCEASNEILKKKDLPPISHSVTIDVQCTCPNCYCAPENMTLNESMDFILFCHYSANPSQLTHVYWYLDGHQLDVAGRPDKYRNGNVQHPSLFVVNASADDMGEYTCRVANQVGPSEVTNSAYVNVQYPPEVVVLAEPEGPFSEDTKPNVTLYCDVIKAHPDTLTRVRWFSNGTLLKELPECVDNSTALYDSQSELCNVDPSRLLLEYVMREFHGNYSCEGMNAAGWGERSSPVPVVVNYRPGQAMIEYYPEVVIKDQPVTLTCNSLDSGRPEASTFRWTRNSHLVPDVTTRDWKIDSASLETKANFTCVPINSEGEGGMASMVINVLARPTFITRLPTYHGALMSADEVSLTCHVECSPNCSIAWLKDNMPLENDTHYSVKNVHLPADFASGQYENKSRDPPEGITISTKRLQVKEDELPSKIKCSAWSYPEPSYYWVHNGETVITGSSILNLDYPIKRNQAGEYECVAENRHGKQKAITVLDVLFKPECKIDRHDTTVGETAALLLICRAYANPQDVSFRWRLGNETLSDSIEVSGLESRLTLEASPSALGTYYCYVNNTVGESIPCEIDVTG
ncbi:Titin [Armadillidium nasatum]|uniref:Titin n=1 Tax=Armadillidium nasatum TaxID=96803 RepID=A0A5N5TP39_9CRUS|nr:Titin [Armadillidium nasatum]